MSLLWVDGFDTYGSKTDMEDGAYAAVGGTSENEVSTAQFRHGASSWQCGNGGDPSIRRLLGGNYTVVGIGAAYRFNQLSTVDMLYAIMEWRSSANNIQFSIFVDSSGRIVARRTSSDPVVAVSDQVVRARRWHHIEARVKLSTTVGEIEVRVDGVTVLSVTGVNTQDDTVNSNIASVSCSRKGSISSVVEDRYWVDDFFVWNDAGSVNNTFLGDLGVRTLRPDGDTSQADFAEEGATGYDAIDDVAPDDLSTYLVAEPLIGSTEEQSEFTLGALPAEVNSVIALMTLARMRNSEGGTVNMQVSLLSGASVDAGTDRGITSSSWLYYEDVSEEDPATSDPWTPSGVNAAQLRLART